MSDLSTVDTGDGRQFAWVELDADVTFDLGTPDFGGGVDSQWVRRRVKVRVWRNGDMTVTLQPGEVPVLGIRLNARDLLAHAAVLKHEVESL